MNKVSIIIPCHNEEKNIQPLFLELIDSEVSKYTYEYIFVDDHSDDETWGELCRLKASEKNDIVRIQLSTNFGHQSALLAGYKHATGDIHITMDGDLQHPPKYIPSFLKAYEEGHNLIIGKRTSANQPIFKKITSSLFYTLFNLISKKKIIPKAADFRLTSKKITQMMLSYTEQNTTFRTIVAQIGIRPHIIEYTERKRTFGVSSYTPSKMLEMAQYALLQNSRMFLNIIFVFGFVVTILSTIGFFTTTYFRYVIKSALFSTVPLFGFFTLANVGVIIIILGVLGLYIANIHEQTLNRPKYHVNKIKKN